MLKKGGKGLITELIYIFVFCICLIISVVLTNQMGLLKDFESALFPVSEETQEKISNKIHPITISKDRSYEQMEYDVRNVSKRYVNNNYTNIPNNLIIRISTLVDNNYIEPIYDWSGNKCTGYTTCNKGLIFNKYKTYLKCGNVYQTKGYEYSKDW